MLVLFDDPFFLNLKLFTVRLVLRKYVADRAAYLECSSKRAIYLKWIRLSSIVEELRHVRKRAKEVNHGIEAFEGDRLVVID